MDAVLDLQDVTKSYPGFTLDRVSLQLPRGYIMGLIGPNGAGKTTLIAMALGLIRPDAGAVRLFGIDPLRDGAAARARVGFVHEASTFPEHLTAGVLGSLVGRFYRGWRPDVFRQTAREFGVPLDRRCGALSRGTRTKLALALALSHDAELLILDEPTSGLDPVFRRSLLERLSAVIAGGRTSVLFSTHITADLERTADYIAFVSRGRLVFASTRDDVMDGWGLVRGAVSRLDDRTRALLRGWECSGDIFTGVTDNRASAARALAGTDAIVERASLDDIMVYTGRSC